MTLQLRDYQRAAVNAVYQAFLNGTAAPLVVMPTGSGKAPTLCTFIKEALEQWPDQRILSLVHVRELVAQNLKTMLRIWPDAPVSVYSAGLKSRDLSGQIVFGSIQSVYKRAFDLQKVDLIVVDEAHLIPAAGDGMYRKLMTDLAVCNGGRVPMVGFTATPFRLQSGSLVEGEGRVFDKIAHEVSLIELIDAGYLCPPITKATATKLDTTGVATRGGEFVASQLQNAVDRSEITERACDEIVAAGQDRRCWLVFSTGVEHAFHVRDALRRRGIVAETVTGETPLHERDAIIKAHKTGQVRCITNDSVLTTGYDNPIVDLLAILRPTQSPGLYCLDSETEILARDGWKKVGEIIVGDAVAGFDAGTEAVRWQPVLGVVDRPLADDEKMVGVVSPHLNFRVTDNHRLVLAARSSRLRKNDSYSWKIEQSSKAMKRKDQFVVPVAGMVDAPGLPLTEHEIAFLGWFLSDGTLGNNNSIAIAQQDGSLQHAHIVATLQGCGFRYGIYRQKRDNGYADLIRYQISFGDARIPNGTGTKGWAKLAPWITQEKIITNAYNSITRDQLLVLMDALNRGDGHKPKNISWVKRTYAITCGRNKDMADRLQVLCVTRGIRCNITNTDPSNWMIRVCPDKRRAVIRGTRVDDDNTNATLQELGTVPGERVWCVSTPMGTIITRRRGKVVITGNCQMVGRGTRLADGKTDCLVMDFGQNSHRFGPIDQIKGHAKMGGGVAPQKECPQCASIIAAGHTECPDCGFVFEIERERKAHDPKAAATPLLSSQVSDWLEVSRVDYRPHHKPGSATTLRIDYYCGLTRYSEWICLEHTGYARDKAERWWKQRTSYPELVTVPSTVEVALEQASFLGQPTHIRVRPDGRFWRIVGSKFPETARAAA